MKQRLAIAVVWLIVGFFWAAIGQGIELVVELSPVRTEIPESVVIRVVAESSSGFSAEAEREGTGIVRLTLPEDSSSGIPVWKLRAFAAGYWSKPTTVIGAVPSASIDLWPAVDLTGALLLPAGEELPSRFEIRFDPANIEDQKIPAEEATCRIFTENQQNRFACRMPAGRYDIRMRPRGFVSHYFWDRRVSTGRDHDLGTIVLEPGSSVTGFIETDDRGPLDEDLFVELRPQTAGTRASADSKLHRLAQSVKPNEKGFFHFPGVAEGMYRLHASQDGYAEAVAEGVHVVEGFESRLRDPLLLTQPREATIQISPRQDTKGERWRVSLVHLRRAGNELVGDAFCDELGFCSLKDLPSGNFILMLYEQQSETPFHHEEIKLDASTNFVEIDLPLVEIVGTVRLGDDPLGAFLRFGGRNSPQAVEIQASPEDGSFQGFLPKAGEWLVDLESDEPSVRRSLRKVRVREKPGSDPAKVEIRLSDLKIEGEVVDEHGIPRDRPLIIFRPEGEEHDNFALRGEHDGTFTLRGMEPGIVHLRATTKDLESDIVRVELHQGMTAPPVRLVVRPRRIVSGVVMSDGGPVPGAAVQVRQWGALTPASGLAVTDAQGNFELSLPRETEALHLEVRAPGYAYRLTRKILPEDGFLLLEVDKTGGELEILLPPGDEKELWVWAMREGASAEIRALMHWARLYVNEAKVEPGYALVPRMAPGSYQICVAEPGSVEWMSLSMTAQNLPSTRCVSVELPPFGRKSASLREDKPRKDP